MRGYGLPRNDDVKNPDLADIQLYGLAGHGYKFHNTERKAQSRRLWKKIARAQAKKEIRDEI